jgi:hypothetical protein
VSLQLILTDDDRAAMADRGLDEPTVRRQLELCRKPPTLDLVRPATLGDGIVVIPKERHDELLELHRAAADTGRFSKFVPASGAATRMFSALVASRRGDAGEDVAASARVFFDGRGRLPFRGALNALLNERGMAPAEAGLGALLAATLDADSLGLAQLPKGLVPFHRYDEVDVRTPFEEQLVEAAEYVGGGDGVCRLHFTVLEAHEDLFQSHLEKVRSRLESELGVSFEVSFSLQGPSTDTVAADPDGGAFRDAEGRLVFRPGGHGALLENLGRWGTAGGDLVYIKNIDNVLPDAGRDVADLWKKLLGGYSCWLERQVIDLEKRAAADSADWFADARSFLADGLAWTPEHLPTDKLEMRELLTRPLRVCGMILTPGDTGGGPFWIRDAHGGESLRIVETSEIDGGREDQLAILRQSTHSNTVDLVCRLRGSDGHPYDLERYVDADAVFVAKKSYQGRPVLGLEHPGLWNGGMARWLTAFVEVPTVTFAPVKTVLDLLRPEHQPGPYS